MLPSCSVRRHAAGFAGGSQVSTGRRGGEAASDGLNGWGTYVMPLTACLHHPPTPSPRLHSRATLTSPLPSAGRRRWWRPWERRREAPGAEKEGEQQQEQDEMGARGAASSNSSRSGKGGNDDGEEAERLSWQRRRAQLLEDNALFLSTHMEERRPQCCASKEDDDENDDEERAPPQETCHSKFVTPHMSSHLAHPLAQRFVDPRVEAAFGTFKYNSQSMDLWALAWTLCLGALSVSSTALVRSFLKVWEVSAVGQDDSLVAFNAIVYTLVIMVYLTRAHRLLRARRKPHSIAASSSSSSSSFFSFERAWHAFLSRHYVVVLLLLPIPVERAFARPLLMALHLVISAIFLLTTAGLLLAHAVLYSTIASLLYLLHLLLPLPPSLPPSVAAKNPSSPTLAPCSWASSSCITSPAPTKCYSENISDVNT